MKFCSTSESNVPGTFDSYAPNPQNPIYRTIFELIFLQGGMIENPDSFYRLAKDFCQYVQENEIADKVGLKVGDVIIEMDGKKIKDTSHFIYELFKHKKGDKVILKYYRDNDLKEVTLTLDDTIKNN